MEVTSEIRFKHKLKIGNDVITLIDFEQKDEEYIIDYIAGKLCCFERDIQNNELLFYKYNDGGWRNGMGFWFSYPANVKTTLDCNSTEDEISKEFIRIYKETIKDNK
jgi:hypothetical protein